MKGLVSRRPSPALVISILALVVAMAGSAFAASQLPSNSVGTAQIKKNAVTTAKVKKNAITLAKIRKNSVNGARVKKKSLTGSDINLNKLGTVPSAELANSLSPLEATHLIGAPGEPGFQSGSKNVDAEGINFQDVGFYKDHEGIVHLVGLVEPGGEGPLPGLVFTLPSGFRPAAGVTELFAPGGEVVLVFGSGVSLSGVNVEGGVFSPGGGLLSGISFRAES